MNEVRKVTGGTLNVMSPSQRRTQLTGIWLLAVLVLGGGLAAAHFDRRPLDDPDLALERPGFLDAHGKPFPAATVTSDVPTLGGRAVIFFTRPERLVRLLRAINAPSAPDFAANVAIVLSGPPAATAITERVVVDATGQLARAYALDRPRDGGPPVGYAIVDTKGRVRYRTLDPDMDTRLGEVQTMLRATP